MIIRLFLDMAGGAEHPHVTAAGYIASDAQWAQFREFWMPLVEEAWNHKKYPGERPFFHAAEFFPGVGHFDHIIAGSPFHRDLARRFAEVAYGCLPNGFAFSIALKDWKCIMRSAVSRTRRPLHVPRMTATIYATVLAANLVAVKALPKNKPERAALFLESGGNSGAAIAWLKFLKKELKQDWTNAYTAFTRVDKEEPEPQAADLLAYETWRETGAVLEDPKRDWDDVTRETFRIITTGPGQFPPEFKTGRVDPAHFTRAQVRHQRRVWLAELERHPEWMIDPLRLRMRDAIAGWVARRRIKLERKRRGKMHRQANEAMRRAGS